MNKYILFKANSVNKKLKMYFDSKARAQVQSMLNDYITKPKLKSFIAYYNKIVLDRERIDFKKFSVEWGLRLTKNFCEELNINYGKLTAEIKSRKDIISFYIDRCQHNDKMHGSFCSKIFHTVFPDEFPPVDSLIRKFFKLDSENLLLSILIIKQGYHDYLKSNYNKIGRIKGLKSISTFNILRLNELSYIRLIDMIIWWEQKNKTQGRTGIRL